jgi:hypothetical protein
MVLGTASHVGKSLAASAVGCRGMSGLRAIEVPFSGRSRVSSCVSPRGALDPGARPLRSQFHE